MLNSSKLILPTHYENHQIITSWADMKNLRSDHSLRLWLVHRLLIPSARYCTYRRKWQSLLGFGLISDGMVGALYLFREIKRCKWVLKVLSVECWRSPSLRLHGHARFWSIFGSDQLRQSLSRVLPLNTNHQMNSQYVLVDGCTTQLVHTTLGVRKIGPMQGREEAWENYPPTDGRSFEQKGIPPARFCSYKNIFQF